MQMKGRQRCGDGGRCVPPQFSIFNLQYSMAQGVKMLSKRGSSRVVPLAALAFLLASLSVAAAGADVQDQTPAADVRRVRYSLTVKNTTGRLLKGAELFVCSPLAATSYQQRTGLDVSHPHEVLADDVGNQVVHITFPELPPYAVKQVSVASELRVQDAPRDLVIESNLFMTADWLVEIEDPAFEALAPRFDPAPPLDRARTIFDWTRQHVRDVGYQRRDRGALYALKEGRGDCSEYMALFVALCRLNGLPARGLGGYVCEHDRVLHSQDYHNWAEFYADGAWHLADPQRGRFAADGGQYVATRVYGDDGGPLQRYPRFRYEGEGLSVSMN